MIVTPFCQKFERVFHGKVRREKTLFVQSGIDTVECRIRVVLWYMHGNNSLNLRFSIH